MVEERVRCKKGSILMGMHTGGSREHKHRVLARVNGLFTPPQWLEFERQALIYKHIVANISIPPNLLVSVRSGFGFPPFSAGYFGSSTLGWRQVGKEDPEPGRCRRTDGKKWRCARDVVADQKYCERHMNRGRHRSRKHVEGHIDHAANVIPTKSASAAPREGGTSGCLTNSLHQTECLQTNGCYPSQLDRMEMSTEKVNECTQDFGSLSSPYSLNSRNSSKLFPLSQEQNPFEEESCGFQHRFILMDSPFKPPSSSSDSIQCSDDELSRNQFVSWSAEEMQYDRTQLSISMPKSSSNLVPASPISKEQMSFSSQESNAINVVREGVPKEASQYQKGQVLISSWECSMAGPLGEVLNNSRHTTDEQCKNLFSSSINFLADGCDLNNWLESSPTHVLQKTNFRSVSSSAWSSPREDNRNSPENKGSLCDDILGSALLRVPTIPS
ncbi:growth-regulating factor 6-like isoform X3 [Zingiber officinale]|uniref:growth-regulating factor 6-like isoform X3 n=1 Tax=Zingiber officinale TaxID=94328 RepID=UPI001C4CD683|nr:growth-regulating factor 6-like isoform X3 [Zingiber officinale]